MRKDTVERKARLLISKAGIENPPVHIEKIAMDCGVQVFKTTLPDEVSGVLERTAEGKNTILVNVEHVHQRQRFTIAHELGHFFLSDRTGVIIDRAIYFRDSKSQQATDYDEIMANTFAAELLMPSHFVKNEYGRFISDGRLSAGEDILQDLSTKFEVSTTAMSIRLQNLGFRLAIG
jgi:Zn-dependent peptidase ImmA (M78 family)